MAKCNRIQYPTTHNCAICGKEMIAFNYQEHIRKTCSPDCLSKYSTQIRTKNNVQYPFMRKCALCGKEFKITDPSKLTKKYCSDECLKVLRSMPFAERAAKGLPVRPSKYPKQKPCAICGKIMIIENCRQNQNKYCSDECKSIGSKLCPEDREAKFAIQDGKTENALGTEKSKRRYRQVFRPSDCQWCPLGIKYEKDSDGEYICGCMQSDHRASGIRYIKVPDRRCRIEK